MKITGFDVTKVRVPAKGNYQMARGTHDSLRTVVVRLYTDKGIVGVGDAHQGVEGYTAETIDTMHTIIASVYGPALIGRDVQAVEAIHADLTDARMGNLFARCAVELALFDALAKFHELGITELLGGPVRKQLKLVGGMGIASPEQMADQAKKMVSAGYKTLKIKIGRPNIQEDLTCIKAVRDRVGDDISIRVDANAAYNLVDALIVARGCADVGVEHLEQPVAKDDIDGMVRVRQLGAVAILADESVHTAEDAYRIIKVGGADAIKIKISKVGGYINARKIIDICEAAGMRVILGQGICSSIEAAGEAHLGCAYRHVYDVAEMVGPAKLQDDLTDNPVDVSHGTLDLPSGAGHGIELSEAKFQKYTIADESTTIKAASA